MTLRTNFVNGDPTVTDHPTHHNDLAIAVNGLVTDKLDKTGGALTGALTSSSYATFDTDLGVGANVRATLSYGKFGVLNTSAAAIAVVVRGAASQSAALLRFQDSAGATLIDVDAAGKLVWGADTNLYRSAADTLKTDDQFIVGRNASAKSLLVSNPHATGDGIEVALGTTTRTAFGASLTSDANYRFYTDAAGKHWWGNGTAAVDTNLYRSGANQLSTDDTFVVNRAAASDQALAFYINPEANYRFYAETGGKLWWGDGAGSLDTNLYRSAANILTTDDDFAIAAAGKGLKVKEGSNARMGTATLVAGSSVVSNTSVTANSRIFLTSQVDGGTPGFLRVSTRTAATSFTITSSSGTDTSTVAYLIVEPA